MWIKDIWTTVSQHLLATMSPVTKHCRNVRIKHNYHLERGKKRNNHTGQNKCCFHTAVLSTFPPRIWEFTTIPPPKNKKIKSNSTKPGILRGDLISPYPHPTHTENPPKKRTEKSRIRCNSPGPGILYLQLSLDRLPSARLLKAASWWCVQHRNCLWVPHRNPQTTAQKLHMEHDSFSRGSHTGFNQSVCRVWVFS